MGILKRARGITTRNWWGYLLAVAAVIAATWIKDIAQPNIIPSNVPITFFLAIVPIAVFFGLGPSILVCILSVLSYDYFFVPPLNQLDFHVSEAPIEAIFLLVGIIISLLSSNLRRKNRIAAQEILTRKKAEAELTRYQEKLQDLVKQRTAALEETNLTLDHEIKVCKKTEEDLRLSEQRWITTLSSIGDAVIATDTQCKVTFINPVGEQLTGWNSSEALNQPISKVFNIINEKTRLKAENPVEKVLEQGIICGLANHTVLIRKDSTEVPIDDSASPIKTEDSTTIGVILIFRDISERKKAIENLQYSKERFEILSEANSLLLTVEKPEQIIRTIASKVMQHLKCDCFFNYINQENTGKLYLNAYAGISEETARQIEKIDHDIASCSCDPKKDCLIIAKMDSIGVQAYACHPLKIGKENIGTLSFGSRSRSSFNEDEVSLMKTVADQISIAMERKLAEDKLTQAVQRLNAHMDNSPLATIEFDPQFRVIRWSKEAEKVFGWNEKEILGRAISEVKWVYEEDLKKVDDISSGFASGNKPVAVNVNRNYRKDGSIVTCEWYNSSIYDANGNLSSVFSQVLDITARKEAEEAVRRYTLELENHRQLLEKMVRERTAELRTLSHRLIMVQEEERRSISRELHDQTGQSLTVLNLILAKAIRSPDNAKVDLQEALKTVREVLAQVRNLSTNLHPGMLEDLGLLPTLNWYFNDFFKKTGIAVEFSQSGLETRLSANLNITIYRIIQEALTNITRYAGVKAASVVVNLEKQHISIQIEDQGHGFNMSTYSQGVGLRGMRERVNALKGELKIQSSPGKGTRINIELPVDENTITEKISSD